MKKNILAGFCLLFLCASIVGGQTDLKGIHKDIVYKKCHTAYEKERCRMDLYLPAGQANFPVLVWFHGGGLEHGDKSSGEVVAVAEYFSGKNIGVAVANYRLSPHVTYPAYIDDAAAAVAWIKKNISTYHGNSDQVFVGGHSAGAYLSAMVGLVREFLEKYSLSPHDITGVIPLSGQMNVHFAVKSERGIPKSKQFVDNTAPKFYAAGASCPFLVLAAEKDSPSTKKQNREFYQLLMDGGLKSLEYIEISGQDHMSTVQTIDDPANETGKFIRSFINRLCR